MTDDQATDDVQRAEVRARYAAQRARVAAISDEEWAARREDEMRTVREWAAARRRNAA